MAVSENPLSENARQKGVFSDVISLHRHLAHATNFEQVKGVVLEAGTLVGEGRVPKLAIVFLVCCAQAQLTFLKDKQ